MQDEGILKFILSVKMLIYTITGAGRPCRGRTFLVSVHTRAAPRPSGRMTRLSRVRASDDDDIPIMSGRRKKSFTEEELDKLRNPRLLDSSPSSVGRELELIRARYLEAEERALQQVNELNEGGNWDGDVYVGSNINTLSVLYGLFMASILIGLVAAVYGYGRIWGVDTALVPPPPALW